MKAVFVNAPGGADQMQYADLPTPKPGKGQALVKIVATGVNFIDVYFRTGLYKAEPPIQLGMEAAGTVAEVGEGVTDLTAGDRVAYAMARGSYAEYAVIPAWQLRAHLPGTRSRWRRRTPPHADRKNAWCQGHRNCRNR
jgi:NADPH:quinone reductase